MDKKSFRITIHGEVQEVGLRNTISRMARSRKLTGYVRNQSDGTVLVEVEGDKDKIFDFISDIKRGSQPAKVEDVVYDEQSEQGYRDFDIK
jgi:acylphosphatase